MIRHLMTLMWNRKRANGLLIAEIFLAFVVLFAVGSVGIYLQRNYRAPLGFAYDNVWRISLDAGGQPHGEQFATFQRVLERLRATPGVVSVAYCGDNTPFSLYSNGGDVDTGAGTRQVGCDTHGAGPGLPEVMGLKLVAGRWFDRRDEATTARPPAVITEATQAALFPNGQSALGKVVRFGFSGDEEHVVIGVSGPYRAGGELSEPRPAVFRYASLQDTTNALFTLLVRVRPGSGAVLEKRLDDAISATGPGWTSSTSTLAEQRIIQLKTQLTMPVILAVVCLFLIVNVTLGLYGVLWLNINERRAELGLRRALGASGMAIGWQVLGEIVVITTFGLLLGLLVAVQFPLLGALDVQAGIYLTAMLLATVLIYALAAGCAFYPSRLAAGIHPAVALREE